MMFAINTNQTARCSRCVMSRANVLNGIQIISIYAVVLVCVYNLWQSGARDLVWAYMLSGLVGQCFQLQKFICDYETKKMSHFYLTLPSNSSVNFYPGNTLTRFTTRLHDTVELNGEWEMGLSEIQFPRTWYNIPTGESWISFEGFEIDDVVNVPQRVYDPRSMDTSPPIERVTVNMPAGHYSTLAKVIDVLNVSIIAAFDKTIKEWVSVGITKNITRRPPSFKYNERSGKVYATLPKLMTAKMSPVMETILGFASKQNPIPVKQLPEGVDEHVVKGMLVGDVHGGIHNMFVYCDLLEHVPVGDTKAPLLRVVETRGEYKEQIVKSFDQPRYVPVQKKTFDSIEIDIRTDAGKSVPFESGKLVLTVHFRRAKNTYLL